MSIDLKSLELFVRIANLGAIGKAGADLGLSRTAATDRLQELEASVGTQLFHRTTRAVSLSADGEIFLVHAKRILADIDEALSEMQDETPRLSGQLRIASSASFGRKFIVPLVAEFMSSFPRLSVQLNLSDTSFDIVKNGYDMSVRLGEGIGTNLKSRRIGESPRIFVASPSFIERFGAPSEVGELVNYNCIIRSDVRTWRVRNPDDKIEDIKVFGNFDANLAEAVTEAVLAGVGIARKCKWEITDHLESGELIQILEDYTVLPEWGIFALFPNTRKPPARVRAFADFMEHRFKQIPVLNELGT
ncbi:MAG: LysR substrate-binding domain-containing protein [Pseudomonadota bacterium]